MLAVYIDLVMILNFFVDFLLLLGTNRLSGFPPKPLRSCAAAAVGGVYGGACLLPGFAFLGGLLWRIIVLALIGFCSFGFELHALKRCSIFLLLSMALGGISVSLGENNFFLLILAGLAVVVLCKVSFGDGIGGREYLPLELSYQGNHVTLTALRDSGNTLMDPVTGESVFLISPAMAMKLTGLSEQQILDPLGTLLQRPIPGLRLIPYKAIGSDCGMLLALRFSDVRLDGRKCSATVAFAPAGLGEGQCFQALVT